MTTIIESLDAAAAYGAAVRPRINGFPYLAEALRAAGVTKYFFDIPSSTAIYATDEGDVLRPGRLIRTERSIIPPFDPDRLVAAIRTDQRGESTFSDFVEESFLSGVIRYEVDTTAHTCTYIGTHGESHVEEYPAVHLSHQLSSPA